MLALLALTGSLQPYLPVAVGSGVAVCVLTVLAVRYGKQSIKRKRFQREVFNMWEPANETSADRRSTVRREGQPVKVLLTCGAIPRAEESYVIDRSTGGVKIATMQSIQVGSTLQIRALNAPDNIPWVTAVVRSNRNKGQHFELGCEFEVTPPWNVLLLFG